MKFFTSLYIFALFGAIALSAQNQPDLLKEAFARAPLGLDAFNDLALANNPTLQQGGALVKQAAGQAKQAGLWPNPSVGYQGEQLRGGDYGGGEQGAFVQQTFVLGGKLGLRKRAYQEQQRAGEMAVVEQHSRVLSAIGQQFYAALAAQQTVQLRLQLSKIAADAVETARQLQNVGQADVPDVLQAEVESEQASLDYSTAQRIYIQQFRSLAALAGKADLPLAPLAGDLERLPQLDTEKITEQILRESPALKRARQTLLQSQASLQAAKRESIPDLTLRAGLEQNYEHLPEDSARSVGLQGFATAGITLPIFNRNQGNTAAAAATVENARAEVQRIGLLLRQQSQSLLQQYLADRTQAESYRQRMIPRAQRAYDLYLEKYRAMASAYPQVIVSQRTLFQLRVAYLDVLRDLWSNAVALQHYTLSDGLAAPAASNSGVMQLNLPAGASVQ